MAREAQEGGVLGALGSDGHSAAGGAHDTASSSGQGHASDGESGSIQRGRRRSSDRVMVLMASAPARGRRPSLEATRLPSIHDPGQPAADVEEADILAQATAMLATSDAASTGRRRGSVRSRRPSRRRRSSARSGSRKLQAAGTGERSRSGSSDASRSGGNRSMDRFVKEAQAEADLASRARQRRLSMVVRGDAPQLDVVGIASPSEDASAKDDLD